MPTNREPDAVWACSSRKWLYPRLRVASAAFFMVIAPAALVKIKPEAFVSSLTIFCASGISLVVAQLVTSAAESSALIIMRFIHPPANANRKTALLEQDWALKIASLCPAQSPAVTIGRNMEPRITEKWRGGKGLRNGDNRSLSGNSVGVLLHDFLPQLGCCVATRVRFRVTIYGRKLRLLS